MRRGNNSQTIREGMDTKNSLNLVAIDRGSLTKFPSIRICEIPSLFIFGRFAAIFN
jgi:hypothetical protein